MLDGASRDVNKINVAWVCLPCIWISRGLSTCNGILLKRTWCFGHCSRVQAIVLVLAFASTESYSCSLPVPHAEMKTTSLPGWAALDLKSNTRTFGVESDRQPNE